MCPNVFPKVPSVLHSGVIDGTLALWIVLRENMLESPASAIETPGRSIFISTRSLCFRRSFSSFFFFLKGQKKKSKLSVWPML